jgi:O-antigen/teichoic acid export membrane protein
MTTVPYNAVLIAHENMKYYSIIGSVSAVLKLLITIYLLYYSHDRLIFYGFLIASVSLLEFLISRIYCHIKYEECEINYKKYYNKDLFKAMRSFAGWQLLYSSSSIISTQGVSVLLNSFFGTIVNAAQGVARQLTGQLMVISNTLMNAVNPVIVKSAGAGDDDSMNNTTLVGSKLSYILIVVFAVPVLMEMPYLLNVWLKNVPEYAVIFCRFEIVQQLIASITIPLVTTVSAKGDIKAFQIFSAIAYAMRLPIMYLFLRLGFNPVSVYYVTIFSVLVLCFGRVYFASIKCNLKVNDFLRKILYPSLLLTLAMFLIVVPIRFYLNESLFRLFCVVIMSTSMLFIGLKYFALTTYEKQLVGNLIHAVKNHIKR